MGRSAWVAGVVMAVGLAGSARGGGPEYNRDVRPILAENCFLCHGPDKTDRKAGLRLDDRASAVGKAAVVPGKPDESELIARVLSDDPDEAMPPPSTHKTLTASQKRTLRAWVEAGAEYQPHWAYLAPKRPDPPAVKHRDRVTNPVDAFILAAVEAKNLTPSPEADRRTLLRRLSLDLTGLPPTPEEVRAFVDDKAPGAYERQVDRLLKSPAYGERMAAPWLDLARFADTVGFHGDQNQNVFPYRDYVIDAFNRNTPFDRFAAEQLAGDLLPDATTETRVASGFNRLNMVTREGGAQPKEYLAKYAADRVRTVATTFLGSTMGCCECHDHKFDPFSAKDFYRLAAFFADVKQWGVYNDYTYTPNPDLKGFTNDHPFPPEVEVESPYLIRRFERLKRQIEEVDAASGDWMKDDRTERLALAKWRDEVVAFLATHPSGWAVAGSAEPEPAPVRANLNGPRFASLVVARETEINSLFLRNVRAKYPDAVEPTLDEEGYVSLKAPPKEGVTRLLFPRKPGGIAALRVEIRPEPGVNDTGALVKVEASVVAPGIVGAIELPFWHADADAKQDRYANGAALLGVVGGWKLAPAANGAARSAVYLPEWPRRVERDHALVVSLRHDRPLRVRISASPFAFDDPRKPVLADTDLDALRAEPDARTPAQARRLYALYLLATGHDRRALVRDRVLRREALACRDGKARSLVTEVVEPATTRVLPRGNWLDESGPVVEPGVPGFLPRPVGADGRRLTRLDLARWLASPDNPLTARVFVNRLWKQLFGAGLSANVDDLGAQGEWPSHPELLDWLAVEFREGGWDVKRLVKLLVMSTTYRQDSRQGPEAREADPGNRLLSAQSPRRLEAEFVRDNALSVAGLLDPEIGGPSAHPYQPAGYYANIQFPDRDYHPEADARQYRRGVYAHWQRTFLHPMLANFDAPSREDCVAARNVANTPQQALTLLNDPTFVEAARVLAARLLADPKPADDAGRVDALFRRVLARPSGPKEVASLLSFLGAQRDLYRAQPGEASKLLKVGVAPAPEGVDAGELAAWANVCRVVLNLHETITRY